MSVIEKGDQCLHLLRLGRRCQEGMINAIVKVEEGSKQIGDRKRCSNNKDYPLRIITTIKTIRKIRRKRVHPAVLDQIHHRLHHHGHHIQAVTVGIVEISRERNINHHDLDHHHLRILPLRVQDQGHDFCILCSYFFVFIITIKEYYITENWKTI